MYVCMYFDLWNQWVVQAFTSNLYPHCALIYNARIWKKNGYVIHKLVPNAIAFVVRDVLLTVTKSIILAMGALWSKKDLIQSLFFNLSFFPHFQTLTNHWSISQLVQKKADLSYLAILLDYHSWWASSLLPLCDLQMQTQNFSLRQQQESLPGVNPDQVYLAGFNETRRQWSHQQEKHKTHQLAVTGLSVTPPYGNTICPHQYNIPIHNAYPHTHTHTQSAKWHMQQHTAMHANIGADARRVTHSLTQFSWCNDPFGTEQHLFSKWRLVLGLLVIFSLTQWAHWEGSILFSTNNQRPVLFRHNVLSPLSCHYQVCTATHIQDQKNATLNLNLKKWLQQGQKKKYRSRGQ